MNPITDVLIESTLRTNDTTIDIADVELTPAIAAQTEQTWAEQKIRAKQQWQKLSDSDLNTVNGDAFALTALLKARFGYTEADAASQVTVFFEGPITVKSRDDFGGGWLRHIAAAKARWSKLGIKELEHSNGIKQSIVNLVRRRYHLTPEDARRQVTQFITKCLYDDNHHV